VLAENNPSEEERVLKRVTRHTLWVYGLFFLGAAFTAILAVISTPAIQNGDFFP
jgi:cell division septal protein FtsQ